MKKIVIYSLLAILGACLFLPAPCRALEVAGSHNGVTYWSKSDGVIRIIGSVEFSSDSELFIGEGVRIEVDDGASLYSAGRVAVVGGASDPVIISRGNFSMSSDGNNTFGSPQFSARHIIFEDMNDVSFYDMSIELMYATSTRVSSFALYNSRAHVLNSHFEAFGNDGLGLYAASIAEIASSTFVGRGAAGLALYNSFSSVVASHIVSDNVGIAVYAASRNKFVDAGVIVRDSSLTGPFAAYIDDRFSQERIDIRNNWWGSDAGPIYGDAVFDGEVYQRTGVYGPAMFRPWLTRDPFAVKDSTIVFFLPGIEASRLYEKAAADLFENQLWEPNRNNDVTRLLFATTGKPRPDDRVYTRDVIDEVNSFGSMAGASQNIYKSFLSLMDQLVARGVIDAWQAIPYDWRFSARNVASSIVGTIADRAKEYSKIIFITHSNGGIVMRYLLNMLSSQYPEILPKVSAVYFVAVPHQGTPQAAMSLLFGNDLALAGGLILKSSTAQKLAQTIPGAYGLLPTHSFVNDLVVRYTAGSGQNGDDTPFAFLRDDVLLEPLKFLAQYNASTTSIVAASAAILAGVRAEQEEISSLNVVPTINIVGEGLRTIYGARYRVVDVCKNMNPFVFKVIARCAPHKKLIIEPLTTLAGDATVLSESARYNASAHSQSVYFDMDAYNNSRFTINRKHADILESEPVLNFLQDSLASSTQYYPFMATTSRYGAAQGRTALMVSVHSPVLIDAYDGLGRHTGRLPDPSGYEGDYFAYEVLIPNSSYWEIGESKYVVLEGSATSTRIEIRGTGTGLTTLVVSMLRDNEIAWTRVYEDIFTVPLMRMTTELSMGGSGQVPDLVTTPIGVFVGGDHVATTTFATISSTTAELTNEIMYRSYCQSRSDGSVRLRENR